MRFLSVITVTAIIFFGITFSMQNLSPVTLVYYDLFNIQIPAYLIIFVSLFTGIILSGMIGLFERIKLSRKLSRLKKEIRSLESEVYEIRKLQIQSEGGPAIKKEYLS